MKLVFTSAEIKEILLQAVNADFSTSFNAVIFDGYSPYSPFKTATFELVEPESTEVQE